MTTEELNRAKELCEKATPEPWEVKRNAANRHSWLIYGVKNRPSGIPAAIASTALWMETDPPDESEANAYLLAESRQLLPLLVKEVERLRGCEAELHGLLASKHV